MPVIIRCRRTGANNNPCFRIVAADSRAPREGKYLENLGWYDPKKEEKNFYLKVERIAALREKGAQVSDMVKSLMHKAGQGLMAQESNAEPAAGSSKPEPGLDQMPESELKPDNEAAC